MNGLCCVLSKELLTKRLHQGYTFWSSW